MQPRQQTAQAEEQKIMDSGRDGLDMAQGKVPGLPAEPAQCGPQTQAVFSSGFEG
jgi:hypothetical protein